MKNFCLFATALALALASPSAVGASTVDEALSLDEIVESFDYRTSDADTLRLYRAFLNREPDVDGSKYWIGQSRSGADADDLSYGFAQSDEFIARYGELNNSEFLDVLYENMLSREPDQAGFDYWLGEMNRGVLSQHGVVRWIVANDEFVSAYPFDSPPERAVAFFQSTESTCSSFADLVGNPVVESQRFANATVSQTIDSDTIVIRDGSGDQLVVDFDFPLDAQQRYGSTEPVVIYPVAGVAEPLPTTYSFGCPSDLYLGSVDA